LQLTNYFTHTDTTHTHTPSAAVPSRSGCITSAAPARVHLFRSTAVRIGPAKEKVGPRTVVE